MRLMWNILKYTIFTNKMLYNKNIWKLINPYHQQITTTNQLVLLSCCAMQECMSWKSGKELCSDGAKAWCLLQQHHICRHKGQRPALRTPKLWVAQNIACTPKIHPLNPISLLYPKLPYLKYSNYFVLTGYELHEI